MEFNDVFKLASIRTAMYNTNIRSTPRPIRLIPHFTEQTYKLLHHLRSRKPEIVDGNIKVKERLMKNNGTYFTDQEEEEYYYKLNQFFEWMREQTDKEKEEEDERWDVPITDTWRFSLPNK